MQQESDDSIQQDSHISLLKATVLAVEDRKLFKKRVESPALVAQISFAYFISYSFHFFLHFVEQFPPVQIMGSGQELSFVLGGGCACVGLPLMYSIGQMVDGLLMILLAVFVCAVDS